MSLKHETMKRALHLVGERVLQMNECYTWTGFYEELATRLLPFKANRQELIDRLQHVYASIGLTVPKLDSSVRPVDIDPYTVFGLFNKGISRGNRQKIIAAFAQEFNVAAKQPEDFDGVPVLNNLNATFYAFVADSRRGEHDIDNLWDVFEAELALVADDSVNTRTAFVEAFERAIVQFGIGWKLSMGLFWTRPAYFVSLDQRSRWFMGDKALAGPEIAEVVPKEHDAPVHDGSAYLTICDFVRSHLNTDGCPYSHLPALSSAAFTESERVNAEKKAAAQAVDQTNKANALGDADVDTVRYWLYAPGAGASMWDDFYSRGVMGLGWHELGNLAGYETKEDVRLRLKEARGGGSSRKNAAHAVWQFVHDVKPGDIVFVKQGRAKILGRGIVTGEYTYDSECGEYPNLREVAWTHKGEWTCDEMFAMKTLTDVTDYTDFVAKVNTFFEDADESDSLVEDDVSGEYPTYGKDDLLVEAYMSEGDYDALAGVLRVKKNVVLQGAPGVGKTFMAKRLAYSIMGVRDSSRVELIQFHQSYSYEDFIMGYRPCENGFELKTGAFYDFCKRAADDSDNEYFFIIDEVNRGNLSKIFGELFMLIEPDKRGLSMRLLYSNERFTVPPNVYLIGTMNTADRSLALMDFALRRRFAFFELEPGFDTPGFRGYQESLSNPVFDKLVACVRQLNDAISSDESLGRGYRIGHSFFCGLEADDPSLESRLAGIIDYELVPLLREYWFDEPDKVDHWEQLLKGSVSAG